MNLRSGLYLAQVISAHPGTDTATDADTVPYAGTLSVLLANYSYLVGTDQAAGLRVRMLRRRSARSSGSLELPEPQTWGVVGFFENDPAAGVWLGSLDNLLENLLPEDLWRNDPYAVLEHYPSDRYALYHGDGMEEHVWPDGTLIKITTRKDGQPGNPSLRAARTPRSARRRGSIGWASERVAYPVQPQPPADLELEHPSGARFSLTADGSITVRSARGATLRIFDDQERGRDNQGHPTTPPGSGSEAGITLEASGGVRLRLLDQGRRAVIEAGEVELAGGTQGAARLGDEVTVTLPAGAVVTTGGVNPAPIVVKGVISSASSRVKIG